MRGVDVAGAAGRWLANPPGGDGRIRRGAAGLAILTDHEIFARYHRRRRRRRKTGGLSIAELSMLKAPWMPESMSEILRPASVFIASSSRSRSAILSASVLSIARTASIRLARVAASC
jgi:hypothetical protein